VNKFRSIETGFHIQSIGNGHVVFQTSNGKYIIPHATGHMKVVNDQLSSNENKFLLKFINRSLSVFKCDFGYVAYRNKQSRIIECNKSIFTLFTLEQPEEGIIYLKGLKLNLFIYFYSFFNVKLDSDGMYWELLNDLNISVTGREPSKFIIELCPSHSKIVLKAANGMYLRAEQNGSIKAICQHSRQATQWEF
jgi:hypothetical protein